MTLLDKLNANYSAWYALDYAVNQYAKRRKQAPAELIAQRDEAHEAYQATLAKLRGVVRKEEVQSCK